MVDTAERELPPKGLPLRSLWKRYGYAWITLGFFAVSIVGHWLFGWFAYVEEQLEHHLPVVVSDYLTIMARDTFENWQSEFLQLLWQVGGLAYFLYVGSPQSREGDDRMEAKLDEIIRKVAPHDGEDIIATLDGEYAGRGRDVRQAHL